MKKTVHPNFRRFETFVTDLPSGLFAYSGMTMHEGRNCVKAFSQDGSTVAVKKFARPNPVNRVVYTFFRGSKAERAYRNAIRLAEMDVNTPKPIGFVDVKECGLIKSSYLATEYTDYTPISHLAEISEEKEVREIFEAMVRFTVSLHVKGIRHNDYNLTNVLYKKMEDGAYDFMLIDINRMSFGDMSRRACLSSIKRMCSSPDMAYMFSRRYAELRGWDVYRSIAGLAIQRWLFERRRKRKDHLKEIMAELARA